MKKSAFKSKTYSTRRKGILFNSVDVCCFRDFSGLYRVLKTTWCTFGIYNLKKWFKSLKAIVVRYVFGMVH